MKSRPQTAPRGYERLALGLWLVFAALPAAAQIGPLTGQTLFSDQAANGQRGNYLELEAGVIRTDNATLSENGSPDTLTLIGLAADTSRQGTNLDYHLDSDLALVDYTHQDYETRPTGYLDGGADLKIVPGLFAWTARETYADVVLNPDLPVTPANVEGVNNLSTGPTFTLRPTLRTTVTLDGTYSYVNSSSTAPDYVDLDNHRYAGDARIDEALSNASSLYVLGTAVQVDYRDRATNIDFTQQDVQAGYRFTDGRTIVDLSAGYYRLRAAPATPTGIAYQLQLSRLISPSQRLALHALEQPTDSVSLLRLNLDQPVATSTPTPLAVGDAMTYRSIGADWRFQAQRTSLEVAFSDNTASYKTNPSFNYEVKVADVLLARQLRPTLNASIGVDFQHQDFADVVGPLRQVNGIANLRWQVGERLGLRLLYAHSALTPHRYTENQVGLIAYYGLIPPSQAPGLLPTSPMSTQPTLR